MSEELHGTVMRTERLTGREALWSDSEGRAEARRERETARRLAEQGHDPEKLAADIRGF